MIKLLALDVDGTLTDGVITLDNNGNEYKNFCVKDGYGIRMAINSGIKIAFITNRESQIVINRARELGINKEFVLQGVEDKGFVLTDVCRKLNIPVENAAAVGDDLNDIPMMKICGFSACPNDAVKKVIEICEYRSPCNGGYGAVRDIIEYILKK